MEGVRGSIPLSSTPGQRPFPVRREGAFLRSRPTSAHNLLMGKRAYGSGSKRERRPGVWELRAGGRTRTVHGGPKDAERELAKLVTTANARGPLATGITLERLLEEWMASATHLEKNTKDSYAYALAHLPPALRKTRLDRLHLRTFDDLYAELDRKGVGRPQIKKLHTALSSALTEAVRWRWIEYHPARGARVPTNPKRLPTMPQNEALDKLLLAAKGNPKRPPDLQAALWVLLALSVGARRGEVLALRWSDVTVTGKPKISLRGSLLDDRSVKATKTGEPRNVAIGPVTVSALNAWRKAQIARALAAGTGLVRDPFVLSNALDGSVPWRPHGATQRWRRLRERADVGNVRLNDLRHASASILLDEGETVGVVANRLGNLPSTTHDFYAHLIDGADRDAAGVIDRRLAALLDPTAG